jgi:hypothetical protein
MARGTRMGEAFLRPGEKPVLPPSLSQLLEQPTQDRPFVSEIHSSSIIAVVATLDLGAVYRQHLGDLPPSISPHVASLGPVDWPTVCRSAIRAQEAMLTGPLDTKATLLRGQPWLLDDFLKE